MKTVKTTNKRCRELVRDLTPFNASNLRGKWDGELYVVYSYGWYPLFIYDSLKGNWFENRDRYSVSTSRQKSQSRPCVNPVELTHEEMKDVIKRYNMKKLEVA